MLSVTGGKVTKQKVIIKNYSVIPKNVKKVTTLIKILGWFESLEKSPEKTFLVK